MSADSELVCYQFGDWLFEPHLNHLRRGDEVCALEFRSVEVLRYLLDHAGQIVSVDDLLEAVWVDRVVEPNVIHRNLSLIRHALGDDPRRPVYIETISKRGYRTIATVTTKTPAPDQTSTRVQDAQVTDEQQGAGTQSAPKGWVLGICILIALGAGAFVLYPQDQPVDTAKTRGANVNGDVIKPVVTPRSNSVAVLPFDNLSPDSGDAYFAAGVHQEIIDRLVKSSDLLVIAGGSASAYAGGDKGIAQVASELGVAAVLTGSVRFEKNRVRLAVQLVDGHSALHLWSQTFERNLDDVFSIQDEIAANIAQQLNTTLIEDTTTKVERNPQAYLLHMQARHLLGLGGLRKGRLRRVEDLLEQALDIAPSDPGIILELSRLYLQKEQTGLVPFGSTAERRQDMIELVLALEPKNGVAHAWSGWHAMFSLGDWALAARQYQWAMALAPNDANVLRALSGVLLHVGKPAEARAVAEASITLDPLCGVCLKNLAESQLMLGDYAGAIANAKSAVSLQPEYVHASIALGIAHLLSDDATAALPVFETIVLPHYRAALVALAQYQLGLEDEFAETQRLLMEEWPRATLLIGIVYAYTQQVELAFIYLNAAAKSGILGQRVGFQGGPDDPLLANLKQDPRWPQYLENSRQSPADYAEFDFKLSLPK